MVQSQYGHFSFFLFSSFFNFFLFPLLSHFFFTGYFSFLSSLFFCLLPFSLFFTELLQVFINDLFVLYGGLWLATVDESYFPAQFSDPVFNFYKAGDEQGKT